MLKILSRSLILEDFKFPSRLNFLSKYSLVSYKFLLESSVSESALSERSLWDTFKNLIALNCEGVGWLSAIETKRFDVFLEIP